MKLLLTYFFMYNQRHLKLVPKQSEAWCHTSIGVFSHYILPPKRLPRLFIRSFTVSSENTFTVVNGYYYLKSFPVQVLSSNWYCSVIELLYISHFWKNPKSNRKWFCEESWYELRLRKVSVENRLVVRWLSWQNMCSILATIFMKSFFWVRTYYVEAC